MSKPSSGENTSKRERTTSSLDWLAVEEEHEREDEKYM